MNKTKVSTLLLKKATFIIGLLSLKDRKEQLGMVDFLNLN
jgi:hypothetical protein